MTRALQVGASPRDDSLTQQLHTRQEYMTSFDRMSLDAKLVSQLRLKDGTGLDKFTSKLRIRNY